ncbi:MAG: TetR/AcrR family transcriptional regulator [Blastococcus sp.]
MTIRLSRVEQVERNRVLLLDAARQAFLERGYTGATVDAIADEAGFSKGVVYSQFAGKPDLFLALLERRIEERAAENDRVVARHTGIDALRALLRANARHDTDGPGWARLLIEFRVAASRDPRINARYAGLHERTLERFAAAVEAALCADDLALVLPARSFAHLILALSSGAVLEHAADPAALPTELLEDVLVRLVVPAERARAGKE